MRIRTLTATMAAGLLLAAVGCVPDPPPPPPQPSTVDQSYTAPDDGCAVRLRTNDAFGQTSSYAQTFTAGRTGTLDTVSAIIGTTGVPSEPLVPVVVSVQTLAGGVPSGTVIGQGTWNGPPLPDADTFADIALSTEAPVTAGTQYALVFENPASTPMVLYCSSLSDDPGYAGGSAFEGPSWFPDQFAEVRFWTWVR